MGQISGWEVNGGRSMVKSETVTGTDTKERAGTETNRWSQSH